MYEERGGCGMSEMRGANWERMADLERRVVALEERLRRALWCGEWANSDREDEKVNLMTMHASKGLEFDTVYLAGVEDNIIPSSRALEEDAKNIDEERRLFYVAITRARKMLTISHCGYRKDRMGERHMALPSRFLEEIPSSLFSEDEAMYAASDEDRIDMLNALIEKFRS